MLVSITFQASLEPRPQQNQKKLWRSAPKGVRNILCFISTRIRTVSASLLEGPGVDIVPLGIPLGQLLPPCKGQFGSCLLESLVKVWSILA